MTHIIPNKTRGLAQPLHQLISRPIRWLHSWSYKDTLFSPFNSSPNSFTHQPIFPSPSSSLTHFSNLIMLGKRPRPMIGKLSELLVGRAAAQLDPAGSPRGPLDMKMQSPRGLKNYDLGGVGLGIVVALDKSSEALPKHAVCASNLNRSGPIPVQCMKNPDGFQRESEIIDVESLEEYTYVTCHVPNRTFTKVYYDGGEGYQIQRLGLNNNMNNKTHVVGVPRKTTPPPEPSFPTSNFLSSCHLCEKKLHGKDIYMYRGEKAFCSTECRSNQIMMDERKERCRSKASRSGELSSSPYKREQIFSTGILAL